MLSLIKPLHANTMKKAFQFFGTLEGQKIISSGWRGAGITEAVRKFRSNWPIVDLVDPFKDLTL